MDREGHNNVTYFIGTEVEHSPAFGTKTLFVVGVQSAEEIARLANEHGIEHIYLGANQSFNPTNNKEFTDWDNMATALLLDKFRVTIDFDVMYVQFFAYFRAAEFENCIPMISVKMPYVNRLNSNTTVKIDDIDFNETNPGVWCHNLSALKTDETYTDWSKYTQDQVLK